MKNVLVVYHSQEHGNTRKMAEHVAAGIRAVEGVHVTLVDVNEHRVDMDTAEEADAYAIGSPDYFSYPAGNIKQFFDDILLASWGKRRTTDKPCVCFLTHGGGGAALQPLAKLANSCKLDLVRPALACRGAPESDEDVSRSVELGKALAEHVAGQ